MLKKIPQQVLEVMQTLELANFEAYIVGGCVRDLLMDKEPKDWDLTTSATPDKIQALFPDSFYENDFGTVGVKVPRFLNSVHFSEHDVVEVTTFRTETAYSDKRRPDAVHFAEKLEADLARRDFCMNAIALRVQQNNQGSLKLSLVDPYQGQQDIENKLIRAVGNPDARFDEDALRIMRAVRFHSQLGFEIEKQTAAAIKKHAASLKLIAWERIRDEFTKIILAENPATGIDLMRKTGILEIILPELQAGVGIAQNRHHIHSIYKHSLLSLKYCPSKKIEVRLAALFHDIAKPQTKRGEGEFATFYNHDFLGAKLAVKILRRFHFSNEVIEKVRLLVVNHMFYYNPEEVGEASVRRLIKRVGLENIRDLMDLRIADRLGSGVPKAKPYKLRHLEYMIEKVSQDAVSVKMLRLNGNDLMQKLQIKPGPLIGAILDVLLAETIEDAGKNTPTYLLERARTLQHEELTTLRQLAKEKIEEKKEEDDQEIKQKHWVK